MILDDSILAFALKGQNAFDDPVRWGIHLIAIKSIF